MGKIQVEYIVNIPNQTGADRFINVKFVVK